MDTDTLKAFLLASTLINYTALLLWFVVFVSGRDFIHRLHGRWFRLADAQFDAVHYGAMAGYKLAILLFNLVPYLALRITG